MTVHGFDVLVRRVFVVTPEPVAMIAASVDVVVTSGCDPVRLT